VAIWSQLLWQHRGVEASWVRMVLLWEAIHGVAVRMDVGA
jgi:hypothetical protein